MQSRAVILKHRSGSGHKRSLPRFYIDCDLDTFDFEKGCSLIENEFPIYINNYEVVYKSKPTLSHFLMEKEFPAVLGPGMISAVRTRLYEPTMRELYQESIHQLKRNNKKYLLSALRWPTGIPTLEFIDYYFEELLFLSEFDPGSIQRYLKLLVKASGLYNSTIEEQIVEIHRRVLMEGKKHGLTAFDLPGNDILGDICVVQAARVTRLVAKTFSKMTRDTHLMIYFSISPVELVLSKLDKKEDKRAKAKGLMSMCAARSYDYFMRTDLGFRETALSTFWAKDWPTPQEIILSDKRCPKKDMRVTKWLPSPPHYPPL
uniref:NSs protein n=1 Tax=Toscana virus TaxID=11590 RepID=A0A089NAI9_TOSV|nr:NSs protein [Toscana virus]